MMSQSFMQAQTKQKQYNSRAINLDPYKPHIVPRLGHPLQEVLPKNVTPPRRDCSDVAHIPDSVRR